MEPLKIYNEYMTGRQISLIYFYVISAASLALIVIGIFNTVNFAINVTQYDKYPLPYIGESCDLMAPGPSKPVLDMPVGATPSAAEIARQKQDCEQRLELERKQHKVNDLRNSITFTLVGVVLFIIHFSWARKQSR